METLIFARHGESEYSARGLVNGVPSVAVALTRAGEQEARALGRLLPEVDLCVTSAFGRVRQTAELALAGRDVECVVLDELGDPNYGSYEGGELEVYRTWSRSHSSSDRPEGGESRIEIVSRYTRAFRALLARTERTVLAVTHSLPIAYALAARDGEPPAPSVWLVDYATPYPFARDELAHATELLEDWCAAPTW